MLFVVVPILFFPDKLLPIFGPHSVVTASRKALVSPAGFGVPPSALEVACVFLAWALTALSLFSYLSV